MVPLTPSRGRVRSAILLAALLVGVAVPAVAESSLIRPQAPAAGDGRILVAQNNQNTAELLVRIQDLEEMVRQLTGRVEGLEFQLQQVLKVQEDNEFRFQQLEGGAPVGKPQAAVPTDGATPSDALPQEQTPAGTADTPMDQLPSTPDQLPDDLAAGDEPMDFGVGESADPLLRGGTDQLGTLGDGDDLSNIPLDLSLPNGGEISNGDAQAQYDAAYDAMTRGDYAFAEEQFRQFVDLFPNDRLAPDAVNYLGDTLLQQGKYMDAAAVLGPGYKRYQESNRAPDIMLKAGVASVGIATSEAQPEVPGATAQQIPTPLETGCRIFAELPVRYPNLPPAFRQRLAQEVAKAQCPVTN